MHKVSQQKTIAEGSRAGVERGHEFPLPGTLDRWYAIAATCDGKTLRAWWMASFSNLNKLGFGDFASTNDVFVQLDLLLCIRARAGN